ncbi:hypothetical protein ATE84_2948 [Aquimarina sp. MAR_2010_214]|uniref:hypothetical protein n=1 Tax=Aquimarina sp. MAR_2010_214 TaxID=1250026 RepID=UPI000CA803B8|nr:hypothetical protein [Aquimarina sp. MAR_2010_214]PKV50880.1 hypothetical protein ATE84_2948 [Aquimarina sp. MAR_2010_214]
MIRRYHELNEEEKQIAITRLASRVKTTECNMLDVLNHMNPLLTIRGGKVVMFREAMSLLTKKIQAYQADTL